VEAVCCSARVALAVLRFCASALPVLALPLVLLWVTPSVPELPWPVPLARGLPLAAPDILAVAGGLADGTPVDEVLPA